MELYDYEFKDKMFSEDGSDRKIGLDRYSIKELNYNNFFNGDLVLYQIDYKSPLSIGNIESKINDNFLIKDLNGNIHEIHSTLVSKPLEKTPQEWWNRWSESLTSCESKDFSKWRNEYRWLFDGFRFSPGGRIMLALGKEYTNIPPDEILSHHIKNSKSPSTLEKSNLTMYNCFVGTLPKGVLEVDTSIPTYQYWNELPVVLDKDLCKLQFKKFIEESFIEEAEVMKHGGGYGMNISYLNTIKGSGCKRDDIVFYIPEDPEIYESINIGKLGVHSIVSGSSSSMENRKIITPLDSLESILNSIYTMVECLYNGEKVAIDFSNIRLRGSIIKKINGRSSGRTAWAEVYEVFARMVSLIHIDCIDFAEASSKLVHVIQQGGSRRGALLILMEAFRIDVVDKFINRKKEVDSIGLGKWLTGANISIGLDNGFMEIVDHCKEIRKKYFSSIDFKNKYYMMKDQIEYEYSQQQKYVEKNKIFISHCPELTEVQRKVFRTWVQLIEASYSSAEPGVIFLERYNEYSNSYYYSKIVGTNP